MYNFFFLILVEFSKYNNTYYISDEILPWSSSRRYCLRMGGELLSIENSEEQEYINTLLTVNNRYWIGFHDRFKMKDHMTRSTSFSWSDGSEVDFTNWNSSEPRGNDPWGAKRGNDDDCVEMNSGGKWFVGTCGRYQNFICKIERKS